MTSFDPQQNVTKIQQFFKELFNTSLTLIIMGILLLVLILGSTFIVYIKPYEFGVKQVNIGLNRGIQTEAYTTGLHVVIPFGFQQMHIFPKDILVLDLTNNPKTTFSRNEKAAYIQTSDGFYVEVDVSILYRINDPLKVINTVGPGKLYEINGIIPKAEPILKNTLGKLTTEEFYNSTLRVEKMMAAKDKMNEELSEKGIKIEHVLVRYFRYSSEIQKNIEDKKLKDQLVFKNQAEGRAAKEEAQLSKVIEEGEALYTIEIEKGNSYKVKRDAEKELYVRKKHAEGDLLIKLAEAEKTRLKNLALQVKGSRNMVGLKMADVLDGIEVIILPSDGKDGINPLNMNKITELY